MHRMLYPKILVLRALEVLFEIQDQMIITALVKATT